LRCMRGVTWVLSVRIVSFLVFPLSAS
jgi:hypothetical protein